MGFCLILFWILRFGLGIGFGYLLSSFWWFFIGGKRGFCSWRLGFGGIAIDLYGCRVSFDSKST